MRAKIKVGKWLGQQNCFVDQGTAHHSSEYAKIELMTVI